MQSLKSPSDARLQLQQALLKNVNVYKYSLSFFFLSLDETVVNGLGRSKWIRVNCML